MNFNWLGIGLLYFTGYNDPSKESVSREKSYYWIIIAGMVFGGLGQSPLLTVY